MNSSTDSYVMPEHANLSEPDDDVTVSSYTFGTLSVAGGELESMVGSLSYASSFAETALPGGGLMWKAPSNQSPHHAMFKPPPPDVVNPFLVVPEVFRGPPPKMQAAPMRPMPPMPAAAPANVVPDSLVADMPVPGARAWPLISELSDVQRGNMIRLLTAAGASCKFKWGQMVTLPGNERWVEVRSLLASKKRFGIFNADPACFEYYAMSTLVSLKS
jgi:hypothetical protein